ncbi:hypothetical protein A2U01_0023450 [Trifolium medium]|uniref:Uncharacterized protein n=1 Tax=Trifolium medium TaxID=97028 RepID=A0A392NRB4_9FABA|nr:hypothetical protein [Trifolium medium]
MARCAVKDLVVAQASGSCASRRTCGAARRLIRKHQIMFLEVVRCAGWRGAPLKILRRMHITSTCALRRTDGAARRHGIW